MVVKARFQDEESYFLINVEPFADDRGEFGRRMFRYFARLWEKYNLPVYPILVLSFKYPLKRQSSNFQISLPDLEVINFQYRVVQLNQMNWRDFVDRPNPVASALMSKMKIAKKDRVKVKAQCLRLLVSLSLNPAKMQMISGFVDTYLDLSPLEEIEFEEEIRKFSQPIQEGVMQITTSWMRQGLEQGIEREKVLIIRLLKRKLGDKSIGIDLESRIMALKIDVIAWIIHQSRIKIAEMVILQQLRQFCHPDTL